MDKAKGREITEKKGEERGLEARPAGGKLVDEKIEEPPVEEAPPVEEDAPSVEEEPAELETASEETDGRKPEEGKAEKPLVEEDPPVEEDAPSVEEEPAELEAAEEEAEKRGPEEEKASEEELVEEEIAEEVAAEEKEKIRIGPPKLKFLDEAMGTIFPMEKDMPVMDARGVKMITPLFFGSLITGIFLGIPFLNLLFVPIIFLGAAVSVVLLRAWGYFKEVVSVETGMRIGVLSSILAVFVSTLLLISLEVLFAQSAYGALVEAVPSVAPANIDLLLKICGLDKDLFLSILRLRFLLCIVIYPIIGGIGGAIFAKYMR
jgi:hypothetical protein